MAKYKFKKSDGGPISKSDAEKWIERYKKKHPDGPWAFFFGDDIINAVIRDPEAVGMRVYLGYKEQDGKEQLQMLLIGAREDGSNIWPNAEGKDGSNRLVGDQGMSCPPYCP